MIKKRLRTVVLAVLLGCSVASCNNVFANNDFLVNTSVQTQVNNNKTIIAHRGASGYLPEHTLESYALAYGMGADYIEADVCISKDGVPVVMHDIYLDTTTNVADVFPDRKRADGRYYIVDFTLPELKQLNLHERSNNETGEAVFKDRFPLNKSKFEIPTLVEEIELIQGLNKSTGKNVGIYPELKNPDFHKENGFNVGKIALDVLDKYGYNKKDAKCIIQCFDTKYLKEFKKELQPKCEVVQLIGLQSWDENKNDDVKYLMSAEGLKEIAKYADGIAPWYGQMINEDGDVAVSEDVTNPNFVKDAHNAGLIVHPYTVRKDELPKYAENADYLLRRLLFELNVDGLFTDFTDLGVKAAQEGPLNK